VRGQVRAGTDLKGPANSSEVSGSVRGHSNASSNVKIHFRKIQFLGVRRNRPKYTEQYNYDQSVLAHGGLSLPLEKSVNNASVIARN
jgi:hypothetical protein